MTTYYAKDANGNLFPVTPTPIGPQAGAGAICVTPAADAVAEPGGAAIAGASMPTGGSGLTGWLSAIWSKLSGTLTVSAASLPLPYGAAQEAGGNLAAIAANTANTAAGVSDTTGLAVQGMTGGIPVPVSDMQSAPIQGAGAMTVGATTTAQRSVGVLCTAPGNVEFQFPDSSTLTLPVFVGWQTFPFAVTQIVSAGTTATATYFNLR